MCKIVPPEKWKPSCQISINNPVRFNTKLQRIDTLQEGIPFEEGLTYCVKTFKKAAEKMSADWLRKNNNIGFKMSLKDIEREYWNIVETAARVTEVEYASDLDTHVVGSGFPVKTKGKRASDEIYANSPWNLNNIASLEGSLLKHITEPITGVNVPWLYLSMLFSSFFWHNEDNYFFSINYLHFGREKQWYSIPWTSAKQFEKASKDFLSESFKVTPDLLHHLTTQISPSLLHGMLTLHSC
jgi:histone demethylase JARID1